MKRRIIGTSSRPRLCVYRSLRHIYAQVIDDTKHHTLLAMSTLSPEIRKDLQGNKTSQAAKVGEVLGKKALKMGITKVVFDRNGFKYHGRVKALATGVRKGGVQF